MKRALFVTTALVVAGGVAAADVTVTGSAELGVAGTKGKKDSADGARLHKNLEVVFKLSGATDTGLSFGGSIDLDEAGTKGASATVHASGAFGTLTLGDTDGGFDKALTEVGSATSIADDHTGHPGYDGNGGLDGFSGNGGHILRYDYSLGGVTASISGEWDSDESKNSVIGAGVAWSGDMGGVGIGLGLGWQSGKTMAGMVSAIPAVCVNADSASVVGCTTDGAVEVVKARAAADKQSHKASILGASASADMGNGLSVVANFSRRSDNIIKGGADEAADAGTEGITAASGMVDEDKVVSHTAIGIAYSVGAITVGVNAGTKTTKTTKFADPDADTDTTPWKRATTETKANGVGVGVVYSLGTGASLQFGVGSGKSGDDKQSSWSAGLAFSF